MTWVTVLLVGLLGPITALAQSVAGTTDGFVRSVWSHSDTVPGGFVSMAQTPDGWLWLAARDQLYRFDGLVAERYPVHENDGSAIASLLATRAGDLWIVHVSGQTVRLPSGYFRHPEVVAGFHGHPSAIREDAAGKVWAITSDTLFQATRGKWREVEPLAGHHVQAYYDLAMDAAGSPWLLTDIGVLSVDKGTQSFILRTDLDDAITWRGTAKTDAPGLSRSAALSRLYLPNLLAQQGFGNAPSFSAANRGAIFDTFNGEWLILPGKLVRLRNPAKTDLFHLLSDVVHGEAYDHIVANAMSPNAPIAILEDRQRNVWLSTEQGLERFQPAIANTLSLPREYSAYAMVPGAKGSIWFGDASYATTPAWWHADQTATSSSKFQQDVTVAYRDTDGQVFLGTGTGTLYTGTDDDFQPLDNPPPSTGKHDEVNIIAKDGLHRLWVGVAGHALYELSHGEWIKNGGLAQLPESGAIRAVTDTAGRLWVSYPEQLVVIDGTNVRRYGIKDGMTIHNVRDIIPDGQPLVAGDNGLALWDGGQFREVHAVNPQLLSRLSGMIRLADGTLWLNGYAGATRINAQELKHATNDPTYRVLATLFGQEAGMPGSAQEGPLPSLVRGTDGRLWFAQSAGVAWIDPAAIPAQSDKPVVAIRSVVVGHNAYRPEENIVVPAGTRAFQVQYTAPGLKSLSTVRFRFRLSGIDDDWTIADKRYTAYYTNISPGHYDFRVDASTDDEPWPGSEAHINIVVEPFFYQTYWFKAILVAMVLPLLWLAYLYRLRALTRNLHLRLEERQAERVRIARDLHDSYLQTVQALLYKVHAIRRSLPEGSVRDSVTSAAAFADQAIVEGRDRVRALRAGIGEGADLAIALKQVADECMDVDEVVYHLTSSGRSRRVNPVANDELYATAREAILNAFAHSGAARIEVAISYGKRGIAITVTDNGKGMCADVLSNGGKTGHWGLRGMRERMAHIGGECDIRSQAGEGTTVALYLPASSAYIHRKSSAQPTRQSPSSDDDQAST